MTDTGIFFKTEANGYDREQVTKYILRLSEAYQNAYDEYQDISGMNATLLEKCRSAKNPEQLEENIEIIAKTLITAETMAQRIVEEAHAEASAIKSEARDVMGRVNAEKEHASEASQKIISDAKAQAAGMVFRARRNIEEVQKTMEQAMKRMEKLLALQPAKAHNANQLPGDCVEPGPG